MVRKRAQGSAVSYFLFTVAQHTLIQTLPLVFSRTCHYLHFLKKAGFSLKTSSHMKGWAESKTLICSLEYILLEGLKGMLLKLSGTSMVASNSPYSSSPRKADPLHYSSLGSSVLPGT